MILSLNEVEATAKRAARGAGYPWGFAEEAAKATRWLCAHGIDCCGVLARLLAQFDKSEIAANAPQTGGDTWIAAEGTLCPLTTGTAISDRAAKLRTSHIRLGRIAEPLMLLPFVAQSASQLQATVSVAWPGVTATTDGTRLSLTGEPGVIADDVTVQIGGEVGDCVRLRSRSEPDPDTLELLGKFSHRTYAPATEESRLLGAGAGLSDND